MSKHVHLVFSKPPDGLSWEDYDRWYEFHVTEILASPGFVAARRYALESINGAEPPAGYVHLAVYEVAGEPQEALTALRDHVPSMRLPEWFSGISFASWNCLSLDERSEPNLVDHAYLVFSQPPSGLPFEEYNSWYATHLEENLGAEGLLAGRRFRLEGEVVAGSAPPGHRHLAMYEVETDLGTMRAGLRQGIESGAIHLPGWFGQVRFVSLDCNALSARVAKPAATGASPRNSGSLDELIDPSAGLQRVGKGFLATEGPVWNPAQKVFYFSDIAGDTRWRWSAKAGLEEVERPTFKANGMAYDLEGNLLVCEQVTSCLVRLRPDGRRDLVAFHHLGKYLNSPNDVVVRAADGSIYFTDPDYGRWNDWIGCQRSKELGFRGLYRVPPDGGPVQLLVGEDEFDQPNGLCFSPDESILYVNDSGARNVKAFDVSSDGSLSEGRILRGGIGTGVAREGGVDGMECDALGNVWVTGPGGVWVLSPSGEHLGVIRTPEVCLSLAFGGEDLRTLLLTTFTTVHVIRTLVSGAPLPGPR